jgi:hypothetical protein
MAELPPITADIPAEDETTEDENEVKAKAKLEPWYIALIVLVVVLALVLAYAIFIQRRKSKVPPPEVQIELLTELDNDNPHFHGSKTPGEKKTIWRRLFGTENPTEPKERPFAYLAENEGDEEYLTEYYKS